MTDPRDMVADLDREADKIDRLVEHLDNDQWALPAPTPGWTVANRIAHLTAAVRTAGIAASDPEAFAALTGRSGPGFAGYIRAAASGYVLEPAGALFPRWRSERDAASKLLAALPAGQQVPWRSGPVPLAALLGLLMTIMFSHGQDIADALGVRMQRTDLLRHVAAFLVTVRPGTLELSLPDNGDQPPVDVRLTGPSGALWEFGRAGGPNLISGPAEDFCLAVTGRRHRDDVDLTVSGEFARTWLETVASEAGARRRTTGSVTA